MSEGRRSQIVLLDERRLEIVIQPKLFAGELLDIVSSHFNIKEKEYFGLAFVDDTGQYSWLQLDKRVLEHEFPKKFLQGAFTLYFLVKYFVESITQLRDATTVEAFYLQAKSLLAKGELEVESETVFQLAALVLQATYGDYTDDITTKTHLKRLPVLPTSTLKEHLSIAVCEIKVIEHYKNIIGYSRGTAIVNYLSILENLATYGQHYYEVKDKSGIPCLLGLSYKGISQYDKNDRRTPRKVFLWKQLENLYFRDKKFTIEVHEARRVVHTLSSFNLYEDAIEEPVEEFDELSNAICDPTTQVSVSRRTLAPANVTVYVWYAASPSVTKCIWSMAIAQHQFFLDRSHRKTQTSVVRNLSEIAAELCHSIPSLSPASSQSNISRSNSSNSIPSAVLEGELSEESKAARIEMLTALRARKEALEDALKKKIDELRSLCLKEGELTGEIPPEIPLNPGEVQPQPRKRIGTSFTLSDKIIYRPKDKERESLNQLELEYEIQSKITSAALKLASDSRARKSVRKQRKACFQQESTKLRNIEEKLSTLKREKDLLQKKGERKIAAADSVSIDDKSSLSNENDVLDDSGVNLSGIPEPSENTKENGNGCNKLSAGILNQSTSVLPSSSLPQLSLSSAGSAPPSPATNCRQRHQSLQHIPPSSRNEYAEIGPYDTWRTPSMYSGGSEYDSISCGSGSIVSLRVPYKNRFESGLNIEGTNLYSVPNRRASQAFDSQDDLLLDSRRNDSVCRSSSGAANGVQIDRAFQNSPSAVPLSASYDERLFYRATDDVQDCTHVLQLPALKIHGTANSSHLVETASLSSYDTVDQPNASSVSSFRTKEKFNLFLSENSLHKTQSDVQSLKLENIYISEPDLNHPESEKVPINLCSSLRRDTARKSLHRKGSGPELCSGASNQSITQVADLVHASILLQDGKRAISVSSLEHCTPKPKTKEWIETSLDSPPVMRKQKKNPDFLDSEPNHSSDFSDSGNRDPSFCSEHIPSEHVISLAPYPMHHFYNDSVNSPHGNECEISSNQCSAHPLHENVSLDSTMNMSECLPFRCTPTDYSSSMCVNHSCSSPSRQYQSSDNQQELLSASPPYYSVSSCNNESFLMSNEYFSSSLPKQVNCVPPLDCGHGDSTAENCFVPTSPAIVNNISSMAVAEPQQPSKHTLAQHNVLPDERYLYEVSHELTEGFQHFPNECPVDSYTRTEQCPRSQPQHNPEHLPVKDISQEHVLSINCIDHHHQPSVNPELPYTMGNTMLKESWSPTLRAPACGNPIPLSPNAPQVFSYPPNVEVSVVSVGHYQPYWEETKPYELSDFYKYSTKHRKHHQEKTLPHTEISSGASSVVSNHMSNEWTHRGQSPLHDCSTAPCHQSQRNVLDTSHQECSVIPQQIQHNDMVVNAHVALVDQAEYAETHSINSKDNISHPNSPSPANEGNCSFADGGLRISLADAFHEEMLAWYQDRDSVKKATLV